MNNNWKNIYDQAIKYIEWIEDNVENGPLSVLDLDDLINNIEHLLYFTRLTRDELNAGGTNISEQAYKQMERKAARGTYLENEIDKSQIY